LQPYLALNVIKDTKDGF